MSRSFLYTVVATQLVILASGCSTLADESRVGRLECVSQVEDRFVLGTDKKGVVHKCDVGSGRCRPLPQRERPDYTVNIRWRGGRWAILNNTTSCEVIDASKGHGIMRDNRHYARWLNHNTFIFWPFVRSDAQSNTPCEVFRVDGDKATSQRQLTVDEYLVWETVGIGESERCVLLCSDQRKAQKKAEGLVGIYDLRGGHFQRLTESAIRFRDVEMVSEFSERAKLLLVVANDGRAELYSMPALDRRGEAKMEIVGILSSCAVSENVAAAFDGRLHVWNLKDSKAKMYGLESDDIVEVDKSRGGGGASDFLCGMAAQLEKGKIFLFRTTGTVIEWDVSSRRKVAERVLVRTENHTGK